jgi:hypothetical protein
MAPLQHAHTPHQPVHHTPTIWSTQRRLTRVPGHSAEAPYNPNTAPGCAADPAAGQPCWGLAASWAACCALLIKGRWVLPGATVICPPPSPRGARRQRHRPKGPTQRTAAGARGGLCAKSVDQKTPVLVPTPNPAQSTLCVSPSGRSLAPSTRQQSCCVWHMLLQQLLLLLPMHQPPRQQRAAAIQAAKAACSQTALLHSMRGIQLPLTTRRWCRRSCR